MICGSLLLRQQTVMPIPWHLGSDGGKVCACSTALPMIYAASRMSKLWCLYRGTYIITWHQQDTHALMHMVTDLVDAAPEEAFAAGALRAALPSQGLRWCPLQLRQACAFGRGAAAAIDSLEHAVRICAACTSTARSDRWYAHRKPHSAQARRGFLHTALHVTDRQACYEVLCCGRPWATLCRGAANRTAHGMQAPARSPCHDYPMSVPNPSRHSARRQRRIHASRGMRTCQRRQWGSTPPA